MKSSLFSVSMLALAAASVAAPASAGFVYINSPLVQGLDAPGSTVAQAKYRLSHTNFDISLDRGAGTNPGQFVSANLGNNNAISGRVFQFTLEHTAGKGFSFSLGAPGSPFSTPVAWGSFGKGAGVAEELGGVAPGASFNSLVLEARASRSNSSMQFSDLEFLSKGLTIADGSFESGLVGPSTSGKGDAPGLWTQELFADTDLSKVNWSLTGLLRGERDAGAGGDETVKFTVGARQSAASVPTTGAASLFLVAGVLNLRRARR
ncbi:MAG: hypothetical protein SFZ24_00940 [Planctomycetota bacterium]|nr:hypothetical protein [Planctomycetota bacterium]